MPGAFKSFIRRLFYRSALVRLMAGGVSVLTGRTRRMGIAHLLAYAGETAIGPLQRDEAIALFGIVKTVRPKTVVEFGFYHGHSAFNFLCALDDDARLFSYDIDDESARRAHDELAFDARLTFLAKSQAAFEPADIGGHPVDLVFFDATHDLTINIQTFERIAPCLAPHALIAIHDTGTWEKAHFAPIHREIVEMGNGCWENEHLYLHQPGERAFVNWLVARGFAAIHLHSTSTLRHGLTLLQLQAPLTVR